ncbi:hypothetical protein NPIL_118201 [Nephila pilipes]|uniref:Uncharacterized protein n=1 Tax=Nephila pilipes TaxID=299642 RepID=A0A8X6UH41_NEPPI|nr:hypothetical protein NPIL_118201 [Nephila pilipes]
MSMLFNFENRPVPMEMNVLVDEKELLKVMGTMRRTFHLPLFKLDSVKELKSHEKRFRFMRDLDHRLLMTLKNEVVLLLKELISEFEKIFDIQRRHDKISFRRLQKENDFDNIRIANAEMKKLGQELKECTLVIYSNFCLLKLKIDFYLKHFDTTCVEVFSFISSFFPNLLEEEILEL